MYVYVEVTGEQLEGGQVFLPQLPPQSWIGLQLRSSFEFVIRLSYSYFRSCSNELCFKCHGFLRLFYEIWNSKLIFFSKYSKSWGSKRFHLFCRHFQRSWPNTGSSQLVLVLYSVKQKVYKQLTRISCKIWKKRLDIESPIWVNLLSKWF